MYEWVAMYISTVYSIPPLLSSTPADSPQSETVSGDHVNDAILSQKVYGELVVTSVTCEQCECEQHCFLCRSTPLCHALQKTCQQNSSRQLEGSSRRSGT